MNDAPLTPAEAEVVGESSEQADDFPEINTPEWDAMNRRRIELIRKDIAEGLTAEEQIEHDRLQAKTFAAIQRAYPRSPLLDKRRLAELAAQFLGKDEGPTE